MKILAFSDIHSRIERLKKILEGDFDILISCGDLTHFGYRREEIFEIIEKTEKPFIFVPGNVENEDIYKNCPKNFINVHKRCVKISGIKFCGLGGANLTPFNTPLEFSEEEIYKILNSLDIDEETILITHFPPFGTNLDVVNDSHVGSKSLRKIIEEKQPKYLLCGHIHECAGNFCYIGKTLCVNVGWKGFLLEI